MLQKSINHKTSMMKDYVNKGTIYRTTSSLSKKAIAVT